MKAPGAETAAIARSFLIRRCAAQAALSRRWLAPQRGRILKIAREARARVDAGGVPPANPRYPLECCEKIRDAAWPWLSRHPLIMELRRKGLEFRQVFYIYEGGDFQNAFQIGDWLLDIAGDAIEISREAVTLLPLDEVKYENLDGWRRYRVVSEKLHGAVAVPNRYFPLLFPLAPYLLLRPGRRLELLVHQDLIFHLDRSDGWRRMRELLADKDFMARELPAGCVEALRGLAGKDLSGHIAEFSPAGDEELEAKLAGWDDLAGLPPAQVDAVFTGFLALARSTAAAILNEGIVVQ